MGCRAVYILGGPKPGGRLWQPPTPKKNKEDKKKDKKEENKKKKKEAQEKNQPSIKQFINTPLRSGPKKGAEKSKKKAPKLDWKESDLTTSTPQQKGYGNRLTTDLPDNRTTKEDNQEDIILSKYNRIINSLIEEVKDNEQENDETSMASSYTKTSQSIPPLSIEDDK